MSEERTPEPAGSIGAAAAVWGALVAPGRTFPSFRERPRWLLPLVLLVVLAVALSLVLTPKLDMTEVMRETLEKSGREVSENELAQQVEMAESFQWLGTISQVVLQPVFFLLIAAVFLACFRMLGSEVDFRQSLAVTTHGFLPYAVATLLSIPVVLARDEVGMDEVRSGSFVKSNLAAFAGEETAAPLLALLGSLDLFSIWTLALLAIGYRLVAAVSRGSAWGVVLVLWGLYVAGKAALASLF